MELDHIGVAVSAVGPAQAAWALLGLAAETPETVAGDGVTVVFCPFSGGRLELLEPLDEDSPVGRFLARRGPGLHHLAFRVERLDETLDRLKAHGVRLLDPVGRPGAHRTRVAFLHPAAMGGVLVELVERGVNS